MVPVRVVGFSVPFMQINRDTYNLALRQMSLVYAVKYSTRKKIHPSSIFAPDFYKSRFNHIVLIDIPNKS